MTEARLWRSLAVKFRSISDPDNQLYARWKHPTGSPHDTRWEIGGAATDEERTQFLNLIKFAGSRLAPDANNSLRPWLNRLKDTRPAHNTDTREFTYAEGGGISYELGTIKELRNACANLCDELELVAMVSTVHPEASSPVLKSIPPSLELPRDIDATQRTKRKRVSATVNSFAAAKKMQNFIEAKGLGQTQFASLAKTTDRTIRSFVATGKVRKDIFRDIAAAMGTTPEELLTPSGN